MNPRRIGTGTRPIIAVGTSAQVYPAVLLIADDRTAHTRRIWVNPETPPPSDTWQWIQATADKALSGGTQASHVAVLDPANPPSATWKWAPVANGNQRPSLADQ